MPNDSHIHDSNQHINHISSRSRKKTLKQKLYVARPKTVQQGLILFAVISPYSLQPQPVIVFWGLARRTAKATCCRGSRHSPESPQEQKAIPSQNDVLVSHQIFQRSTGSLNGTMIRMSRNTLSKWGYQMTAWVHECRPLPRPLSFGSVWRRNGGAVFGSCCCDWRLPALHLRGSLRQVWATEVESHKDATLYAARCAYQSSSIAGNPVWLDLRFVIRSFHFILVILVETFFYIFSQDEVGISFANGVYLQYECIWYF